MTHPIHVPVPPPKLTPILFATEALTSPVRNRFFYGKLLDQIHLTLEQGYINDKRWLLNRHGFGSGVMCGLSIVLSGDTKGVMINPGVALDALGHEIIVPQRSAAIDPRQLTDPTGVASGQPLDGAATVLVGIVYHECDIEPTPSLACECDDDGCQYGAIRERYAIVVEQGQHVSQGTAEMPICDQLFTPAGSGNAAAVWDGRLQTINDWYMQCRAPSPIAIVPLAVLTVDGDGTVSHVDYSVRVPVVSNVVLLDLILCLASELDACCGQTTQTLTLTALSRVSQTVNAGDLVAEPPSVRVDRNGQPSANETVTWSVGALGGLISADGGPPGASATSTTDASGTATLSSWRAPQQGGSAKVLAAVSGATPASVTFNAKVEAVAVTLPHIVAVWPPNGARMEAGNAVLGPNLDKWLIAPFLDLTFDEAMNMTDLQQDSTTTQAWLRTVLVADAGTVALTAGFTEIPPTFGQQMPSAIGGQQGFTYRFQLNALNPLAGSSSQRRSLIVLVRSDAGNIRSAAAGQLLDPDFDAHIVQAAADPQHADTPYFDAVWDPSVLTAPGLEKAMALKTLAQISQDATPAQIGISGDGLPGGRFHSYMRVGKQG